VSARRAWWTLAQVALGVAVVGLAVRSLARNWDLLQAQPLHWDLSPAWLVLALATVWLAYALLVEAWRRVVTGMRQGLGYVDAARICMLANLGRYVPGKVWSIAGTAMLSRRAGVDASAAVASAFVLQALSLASAVVVLAVLAPTTLAAVSGPLAAATIGLGCVAGAGVLLLTSERALATIRRLVPVVPSGVSPVPLGTMLLAFAANVVAWGAYGFALQSLARGLTGEPHLTWLQATAVFTASYVVGLVAVFAPAGVGPRESVMVLLLQGPMGPKVALALAIAARVLWTVAELGAALPFLVQGARRNSR
jgi:hypothetical protein